MKIYHFDQDGKGGLNIAALSAVAPHLSFELLPQDINELRTRSLEPGIVWFYYHAHLQQPDVRDGKNWFDYHKNNQLTDDFISALKVLQDRGLWMLIDYFWESENSYTQVRKELTSLLDQHGVDSTKIIWGINNAWQRGIWHYQDDDYHYRFLSVPWWLWMTHYELHLKQGLTPIPHHRETTHDVLALNRRGRLGKIQSLLGLHQRIGIDRIKFSLCSIHNSARLIIQQGDPEYDFITHTLGQSIDDFEPIQLEGDVYYGSGISSDDYLFSLNPKWYADTKVSMLNETACSQAEMYSQEQEVRFTDSIHITEKTFKTLYMGHPFVLLGQARSLEAVRALGFETYGTVINEDYDICSDQVRMHRAIDQIPNLIDAWQDPSVIAASQYNSALMQNTQWIQQETARYLLAPLSELTGLDFIG